LKVKCSKLPLAGWEFVGYSGRGASFCAFGVYSRREFWLLFFDWKSDTYSSRDRRNNIKHLSILGKEQSRSYALINPDLSWPNLSKQWQKEHFHF